MTKVASVIRDGAEIAVYDDVHRFSVTRQPINPKTGKAWQSKKYLGQFDTKAKAMVVWLKATRS